jgi:LCP family protein required for cell wall assembly
LPDEASGDATAPELPPLVESEHAAADLDAPDAAGPSRSDLQAELRKTHKKEQKHKHRWRRRSIWALSIIVVLAGLGTVGAYYYAKWRYDQIKKIHSRHLTIQSADPTKPFNVLLVGSDSRAFVGDNSTLSNEIGNEANAGGQRSDVTIVARINPAGKTVTLLSIPRDLWVDIPGNDSGISGMNRINAAYDSGPDLLIQTIEKDLGITINHYVAVNFPGFSDMVNALGGITMDFPTPVKDSFTGLDVTQTGCQTINGTTALQLVRARHLYYLNSEGYWEGDGLSDFSRILRQDAFFRAVLAKVNASISITSPLTINSFLSASVGNITIDDTLTEGDLYHIAQDFRGLPKKHLVTETLPVTSYVTDGGADVLQMAQPYAQNMIDAFNAIGTAPPATPVVHATKGTKRTATTTTTTLPHGQVNVDVLNASSDQAGALAGLVSATLRVDGFTIGEVANASSPLNGTSSEVLYGPAGLQAAQTLNAELQGPVTLVADPSLTGSTVQLLVAGTSLIVSTPSNPGHAGNSGAATTGPTTTTTTTIPPDVYTNTQKEPWNPFPCNLGASTQAAPGTTTTVKGQAKKG